MEPTVNPVTTYTSGDGKVTSIAELNNFHLVNALLKTVTIQTLSDDKPSIEQTLNLIAGLKGEVLKRMDNRPAQV